MGDSLTCCGCEGLAGFENINKCNLNFLKLKPEEYKATEMQKKIGTAEAFAAMAQNKEGHTFLKGKSFEECIQRISKLTQFKDTVG
jgi:hypothetical protein